MQVGLHRWILVEAVLPRQAGGRDHAGMIGPDSWILMEAESRLEEEALQVGPHRWRQCCQSRLEEKIMQAGPHRWIQVDAVLPVPSLVLQQRHRIVCESLRESETAALSVRLYRIDVAVSHAFNWGWFLYKPKVRSGAELLWCGVVVFMLVLTA